MRQRILLVGCVIASCTGAACGGGGDDGGGGTTTPPQPVAHDDAIALAEGGTFDASALLANDVYATDYDAPELVLDTMPAHGTFDGYSHYQADAGFHGTDSFSYHFTDYGQSNVATVTVTIASNGVPYEQAVGVDQTPLAALATADLDGDGRVDLIGVDTLDAVLVVLTNASTPGHYAFARSEFEGGSSPLSVAVADFDGDGRPDIVTASEVLNGLAILQNITPAGAPLAFAAPVSLSAGTPAAVVAADLDGDGRPDLAAVDAFGGALIVRLNTSTPGTITFGPPTSFATPPGPISLQTVDADGAGGVDLAVLSAPDTYQAGAFSLFINATAVGDTTATFAARVDRATGVSPTSLFIADLDGDGHSEVGIMSAGDSLSATGLWIYANRGAASPTYEAARVLDARGQIAIPAHLTGGALPDLAIASSLTAFQSGTGPLGLLVNHTTPTAGYAFTEADSQVGLPDHDLLQTASPTALQFVELDGVAPAELVMTTSAGTFVMFGD